MSVRIKALFGEWHSIVIQTVFTSSDGLRPILCVQVERLCNLGHRSW